MIRKLLIAACLVIPTGCTTIYAENVLLPAQFVEVETVDRAWVTGEADVAHVDSLTTQRLEWYPNGR